MKKIIHVQIFDQVLFSCLKTKTLLQHISIYCQRQEKKLILNMNTQGVVTYLRNKKYATIIKSADIIYPDGWGPILASKIYRQSLPERINVGDFIHPLLQKLNEQKAKIYLLGCEDFVVKKAVNNIKKTYSDIKISGFHHGFFDKLEEKQIIRQIQQSRPYLVLVGMGLPLQEYWIKKHWKDLPPAVYMGVGGVFHYIAGTKARAPRFMCNYGLEWLYRLVQEPSRLWKRYTIDNIIFATLFFYAIFQKTFTKK